MTTVSLLPRPADAPTRRRWREAVRVVLGAALRTATGGWAVLRTLAVIAARVVLWCSCDVRRLRTILLGLATCAVVGALAGLGTGLVLTRVVRAVLGIVS